MIIAFSLTSCVSSLQPLVTLETITTDNSITGNWTSDKGLYTIKPLLQSDYAKELANVPDNKDRPLNEEEIRDSILLSKMYIISFTENGVVYNFGTKLIRLNGQLFADLYPVYVNDGKSKDDPFKVQDYLPGFTIARIEMSGPSMTVKFIDGDFIMTQVREGRMKLKHEANELFGTFMITASTEELKQFVSKYGNDERIFSKNTAVTLTRKLSL